ncbi:SdrD B-like domain-containing protein [Portibacter lacus]|uniref:Secretion system C-terminal sorting domain-containing protein n=1 Tax=Portibacter lacus TaxID=1099794 RepID=A0AA37WEE6_9BACT|nr:SdrD B-like domain-containing protein [Portibacter lacus]GLR17172.1 hypothetical protein GCM10007940_17870 [Portibacter lacus]
MKQLILIFFQTLIPILVFSQSGTIDFNLLSNNNYNQTINGGNGITAEVIYSGSSDGTQSPVDIIDYRPSTNGAEFTIGCVPSIKSNGQPDNLEGLFVVHDYLSTQAALDGNYFISRFSEPLCDVEFKLVDLTSPGITGTYPSAAQAVYNDQVIITGIDADGNTVVPTISIISRGVVELNPNCTYTANIGNSDLDFCASDQVVDGNRAYVNGGAAEVYCNIGGCLTGVYFNSMDVQVDFNGVCLSEVSIQYNNNNDRNTLHVYESNNSDLTCNNLLLGADQQPQAILFEDYDYASVSRGIISGSVLADINNDDDGENPLGDVTITLYLDSDGNGVLSVSELLAGPALIDSDGDGMPDDQAITQSSNVDGSYTFNGVPAGNYIIIETDPSGYFSVQDGDISVDDTVDDVINSNDNDNAIPITLLAGEEDGGNNFIDEESGSISGVVSADSDNDGDELNMGDPEELLSNITVTLYADTNGDGVLSVAEFNAGPALIDANGDGNPNELAMTTTDVNGNYSFSGISPGNYIVVETDPNNYASVYDGDDITDSGTSTDQVDGFNNNSIPATIDAGEVDTGNNFVDEKAGLISGTVYLDEVDNGTVDKTSGVDAITMSLLESDGSPVLDSDGIPITATTNASGYYEFLNVPPGNYLVEIGSTPNSLTYENDDMIDGAEDEEENDGSTINGRIPVSVGVGTQETDSTNDFVTSDFILPVELISFNAFKQDNGNLLKWSTSSEIDNQEFNILHSVNGKDYRMIGKIIGQGTTEFVSDYEYLDRAPSNGSNFYQLIQVDFNGNESVMGIKHIKNTKEARISVYPNPVVSKINISGFEKGMKIFIVNQAGKVVNSTNDSTSINIEDLTNGIYFIRIYDEEKLVLTEKILKL